MAVGQNQWYRFGVGAPPILEPILVGIGMFTDGILTHGHVPSDSRKLAELKRPVGALPDPGPLARTRTLFATLVERSERKRKEGEQKGRNRTIIIC